MTLPLLRAFMDGCGADYLLSGDAHTRLTPNPNTLRQNSAEDYLS